MPLLHCTNCHHEWESTSRTSKCDWCGAAGEVIEEKTPLERMAEALDGFIEGGVVSPKRRKRKSFALV